jgi:histidyl-tRNA synthetase
MKAQMKLADRSGAAVAVIVGEQELGDRAVTVRDLRSERAQYAIAREEVTSHLQELFR